MMKRMLALLAAALCLALTPAMALAAEPETNSSGSVFACGCAVKIVAGTTEGYTNVLWDKDGDGVIEDDEFLKIGSAEPTAAGYDMSSRNVYGASKGTFSGNTSITMTGGSVANVFGGGNSTRMTGNASVVISGGTVKGVYGGGAGSSSVVTGNTSVIVTGGRITGVSAGASYGSVAGSRALAIGGNPEIGTLRTESGDYVTISGGAFGEFYGNVAPSLASGASYHEYDKQSAIVGSALADFAAAKDYAGEDSDQKWVIVKIPEFKVTYSAPDATGGTAPTDSTAYIGGDIAIILGSDLERTGYSFDGWNTEEDGSGDSYDAGGSMTIAADTILYAQWKPVTYYVRFDANGGDGAMADQAFSYDESKGLSLNAFSKAGHSFDGWIDPSGTFYGDGAAADNLASAENAVVTLYAQWAPNRYAVAFDTDGGSGVAPQTIEYGQTATEPEDPTKSGYTFGGWYADAGLTTKYDFSTVITAPITIYAKWNVVYYPIVTPTYCPLGDYDDLNRNAWYHDGVHWAIENSIMTGTHDAFWEPESVTTRAMVAVVLYRMEGEPNKTGEGAWYADATAWAVERGIFKGYGNDPSNLGPNDPITREQLAVVLWRYVGDDATADLSAYPDAGEVSAWAEDAMRWAVSEGVITGRGGTLLAPAGETERAEFATMLRRLI